MNPARMTAMGKDEFLRLRTSGRLDRVKAEGDYLGSRVHGGHQVHLYRMGPAGSEGYFCEVWMRLGLRYVEWVEVANRMDILQEYVHLDLEGK